MASKIALIAGLLLSHIAASAGDELGPASTAPALSPPILRPSCQTAINEFLTKYEHAVKNGLDLTSDPIKKEFEAGRNAVTAICEKQTEFIKKFASVYTSAVEAEACAEKLKMLQALIGGEPIGPSGPTYPRITGAWFGDIINDSKGAERLVCDARIFFHDQCANSNSKQKPKLVGPGYCVAERSAQSGKSLQDGIDLCGYDPAPWSNVEMTYEFPREKFVVVQYDCGKGTTSTVKVPAASQYVPIICEYTEHYPDTRKLDLEGDPCKIKLEAKE